MRALMQLVEGEHPIVRTADLAKVAPEVPAAARRAGILRPEDPGFEDVSAARAPAFTRAGNAGAEATCRLVNARALSALLLRGREPRPTPGSKRSDALLRAARLQ